MIAALFNFIRRRVINHRNPDYIVGTIDAPYLRRWWLIPRNRVFNIYLHEFQRSDDDRALHDHPWWSLSLLLHGQLTEHTIAAGGIHRRRILRAGQWRIRTASAAHRIEIAPNQTAYTLFITGPVLRGWGFHCPRGWVPWQQFTQPNNPGQTGPGCSEEN